MGREDIVNRSDGEHSIVSLKEKAAQLAEVEAVLEESPVGQSRINGEIECAVKEVRILLELEELFGAQAEDRDQQTTLNFGLVTDVRCGCSSAGTAWTLTGPQMRKRGQERIGGDQRYRSGS